MELADNPCTVRLILKKIDGETNSGAQGHASLEGVLYELVDSKGKVHQAKTAWDESYKAWAAVFEKLPRGRRAYARFNLLRDTSLTTTAEAGMTDGWR